MDKLDLYKDFTHVKPYATIEKALTKRKGLIHLKNPNNFTNLFYLIIDTYLTVKILKTIQEQNQENDQRYSINYLSNSKWDEGTIEIVLNETDLVIEIITGNKSNQVINGAVRPNYNGNKALEVFSHLVPLMDSAAEGFPRMEIYNLTTFLKGIAQDE